MDKGTMTKAENVTLDRSKHRGQEDGMQAKGKQVSLKPRYHLLKCNKKEKNP